MHHDLADGILAKARVRGSSYMWRPEAWENPDSKTHMIIACSYQNELIPTVPDSSSWNSIHWFVRINLYDLYRLYLSTDQHYLPSGLNDSHTTLATVRFSSIRSVHLLFSWPFPLRCPEFATEHGPCFSLLKDKVIISWWGWKNQVATVLQKMLPTYASWIWKVLLLSAEMFRGSLQDMFMSGEAKTETYLVEMNVLECLRFFFSMISVRTGTVWMRTRGWAGFDEWALVWSMNRLQKVPSVGSRSLGQEWG